MAVTERDVVLMSQTDGSQSLDYPITRLKNIEATADEKSAPAEGDYLPLLDGADSGQMKKVAWAQVKDALSSGGAAACELAFAESDWTDGDDGYAIVLPRTTHGRQSGAFGFRLWHSVDGVLKSDTWAAVGTQAVYDPSDGSITLNAADAYTGAAYFYDL